MSVTAAVWHQLGSFTGMEPWGEDNDIVVKIGCIFSIIETAFNIGVIVWTQAARGASAG